MERHDYDDFGRSLAMYSPYDDKIPAVSYEYITDNHGSLYARTANKVSTDPEDEQLIYTLIKLDGLGRPIYTAKTGYIAHLGGGELGWNVSGAVSYDEKGRAVRRGRPSFQAGDWNSFPSAPLLEEGFITQTDYDDLDRPVKTIHPSANWGEVYSTYGYRIDGEHFSKIFTDPQSRITVYPNRHSRFA